MNHGRFTRRRGTAGTPHWCATCGHHLGWGSQGWSWVVVVQKMRFPAQQLGWFDGALWMFMGFNVFFFFMFFFLMGFNDQCFFCCFLCDVRTWSMYGPCKKGFRSSSCLERVRPIDLESLKLFGTKKQGLGLTWIYVWAKRSDSRP